MARVFDRNMFIMLLVIMIGVVIITSFIGDIVNRSQREELISKHSTEIRMIESKNINFTRNFVNSLGLLDLSREDSTKGNYNFDLASIWYSTALYEKNSSNLVLDKTRVITNCNYAVYNYTVSHDNFIVAKNKFTNTKNYTNYEAYLDVLDLYVNLSESGSRLANIRKNASIYLKYMTENLTIENGSVTYSSNISDLLNLFNTTIKQYNDELKTYNDIKKGIEKEYDIIGFSEIREE